MATNTPKTPANKRKGPRANAGATTARRVDLKARALEMLLAGNKCPAIGEALGVTRQTAWQYAKDAIAELKAETLDDAAEWRTMLTAVHLEQMAYGKGLRDGNPKAEGEKGAWPGDPKGADVVDKAASQLKALWIPSLPTSVKTELTGANGGPLQTQALGAPDLTKLTDSQLAQLTAILESVIPAEPAALLQVP